MKLFRIMFILLFLIISIGAVSAQDNLNDTMQADIPSTEEVGSFEELENDITNANSTMEITKDYINDDYPDGIRIERDNLVINGNNHTIDGNGQNIFCIKGSNITINNLVFKNAYYDFGGAIYSDGALALNNVTFADNGAGKYGGAIYNCGDISLGDCVFADNSADGAAGAIFNSGSIDLSGCVFADNCAGEVGGAIYNIGDIYLSACVFDGNGAGEVGGAISNFGGIDLSGCVFTDNGAGYCAGAIYTNGDISLCDCAFEGNGAGAAAGAIYVCDVAVADSDNVYFANNSAKEGGAIYADGNIALSGGGFADNVAELGGAIYILENGGVGLNNVSFADNSAERGGAVYDIGGRLDICNTVITSKNSVKYGQIYSMLSTISIDNLTVANITAPYSPAMYIDSSNLSLVNSRFVNLTADVSAGAISARDGGDIYIENCEFINTTSSKNAGAIHLDILGRGAGVGNVTIIDTLFKNVRSGFGGALIQLGGNLLLNDSDFIKNSATFDGGAAYLSHVNAKINGCTFDSDSVGVFENYPTYGGAIYFDYGNLTLHDSRFANTSSYIGSGAICIYDSFYEIANSTFDGGEAVHAIFKREGSQVIECSGNFTVCDENVFYPYVIVGEGMNLTPVEDDLDFDELPSRFDLRDYNWTSPVMYQGDVGACWEIANMGALESALLKSLGLGVELSVNNMKNTMLTYSKYGSSAVEGGTQTDAVAYCLSWMGAFPEELDTYDEVGKISHTITGSGNIHIQNVVLNPRDCEIVNGDPRFKQAILKYGALSCGVYGFNRIGESNEFYNDETNAQYAYNTTGGHVVSVVGWDDSFSRENFITAPPGDGAWICKNSWGCDFGDGGYYYVSYYDTTLGTGDFDGIAYSFENTMSYNKNYQYDFDGMIDFYMGENQIAYSNTFESCGDDLIAAVGTYFSSSGIEYRVEIKVNGELVCTQEGISPYFGYHTIKLDRHVPIKKGDNFSATITADEIPIVFSSNVRPNYAQGISYMFENGSWVDLHDKGWIACLKVYTVADDRHNATFIAPDRVIGVSDAIYGYDYQFILKDENGTALANKKVLVSFNGENQTVVTDKNGWGTFTVNSNAEGTYTVEIIFKGSNDYYGVSQNATVKLVRQKTAFIAPDRVVYVRDISNGYEYSAILKDNYGQVLANKKVLFVFNGKKQVAYTDENGWATVTLKVDVSGVQSLTIKFAGDRCYRETAITKTINVVREPSVLTTVNKAFVVSNNDKKVTVTLKSKSGNPIYGAKVTFTVDGRTYSATTDGDGVATFSIDLFKLGTFHASTRFEDSRFYAATTTTSKVIIY